MRFPHWVFLLSGEISNELECCKGKGTITYVIKRKKILILMGKVVKQATRALKELSLV